MFGLKKKEKNSEPRLYSKEDLKKLIYPLIIEQVMLSLMGIIDTLMVANVGESAVSAVSCVDSINKLVVYLLQSIATGGVILCSQYIGYKDQKRANDTAGQVLLCGFFISLAIMGFCLIFRNGLLSLIFGSVEADVMDASRSYFLITALSYPPMALFSACSAIYRATGNSRLPMTVSAISNILNIIGNALLLFVVKMGVAGAAISTTGSVVFSAVVMLYVMRQPGLSIRIGKLTKLRPKMKSMLWVLKIGIPTGVENSMFQFGKLVVQSTVSTLGTAAIASNAIVVSLELISSMPPMGMYIGLMTIVGTCIGAGRTDDAKYYIRSFTKWGGVIILVLGWAVFALTLPIARIAGLSDEAVTLTVKVMLMISVLKPFLWPCGFIPNNGMRAAGDGPFSMIVSTFSMWIARVALSTVLCRVFGLGLFGIWIGYEADWAVRSICNIIRFRSGKWTKHQVMQFDVDSDA